MDLPDEIAKHLPEGHEVRGVAGFQIQVIYHHPVGDEEKTKASVLLAPAIDPDGNEPPFEFWMAAAEYLTAVTASKSNAGYEKAIEMLTQGAMTYKHILNPKNKDSNEQGNNGNN